jgi:hypothetical protein
MKPLNGAAAASALRERILSGEGAMLRSLRLHGPSTASLTLSVQDKQRGFDWIDLTFEMHGISDARLIDDEKLDFLDTDDGITVLFEEGLWGLGVGRYSGLKALRDAPLYLIGTSLKYEEAPFSG